AGFGRGTVLVAHNARFDVSFLRAAAAELGYPWPGPVVVDTLALARRALTRDEVPNFKLGTLARVFAAATAPDHRALSDARATTDVLHRLLERLAPLGLSHLEDLRTITDPVPAARRRKSTLADDVPHGPGVYQFIGPSGEVLYVGTATDLRSRVRSYFTAAEKRSRIGEMVDLAVAVRTIPCANALEAQVREVRLIDSCDPPYNRRSRRPSRRPWIRLTDETYPRLSVVRSLPVSALDAAWGPFGSHRQATAALEALQDFLPLRSCTPRLPRIAPPSARSCMAAEIGACPAPCVGAIDSEHYAAHAEAARAVLGGAVEDLVDHLRRRIEALSASLRYEDALEVRERLRSVLVGAARAERLRAWARLPEVVAAQPAADGWDLVLARYGRFAGSVQLRPGGDPVAALAALHSTAEHVEASDVVGSSATAEETELVIRWCEAAGTRLVELTGPAPPIALPIRGAHRWDLPPTG
ncbi:MAG: DEDD exonuclease domain-containing protein, partial [Actinomycetota bacterium]